MTKLMKILADAKGDLSNVRNALPVSGETGSLAARFTGKNADAAGHILAKTGWINHGYTLGGIIKAKDGTQLLFAIYALGNVKDDAKVAIDNLATAIYRCGDTLSNE
jgi:D-alanyl-D-alanine carboxypeptidase/D-alanyl-D-alanine-endopeptidase (penicillin-binding protein 4)